MSSDKYARLAPTPAGWFQFGIYDINPSDPWYTAMELWYKEVRICRPDMPEWPITIIGPREEIRVARNYRRQVVEMKEAFEKELKDAKNTDTPVTSAFLKSMKEGKLLLQTETIRSRTFKIFLQLFGLHHILTATMLFFHNTSQCHVAAAPGTRKFLCQTQDMVLHHCDQPRNPNRRPWLVVSTNHPKLDVGVVMNALNLAQMKHLKKMGNVRLCKNWVGDKREELREYRKHLFLHMKGTKFYRIPTLAATHDHDLSQAYVDFVQHRVTDDPPDGDTTPPRSASPDPHDPYWEGAFELQPPPPVKDDDEDVKSDTSSEHDGQPTPGGGGGKHAAKNKRKRDTRRRRKAALSVMQSVSQYAGQATPMRSVREEAKRVCVQTPASFVAPATPDAQKELKEIKQTTSETKTKSRDKKRRKKVHAAGKEAIVDAEWQPMEAVEEEEVVAAGLPAPDLAIVASPPVAAIDPATPDVAMASPQPAIVEPPKAQHVPGTLPAQDVKMASPPPPGGYEPTEEEKQEAQRAKNKEKRKETRKEKKKRRLARIADLKKKERQEKQQASAADAPAASSPPPPPSPPSATLGRSGFPSPIISSGSSTPDPLDARLATRSPLSTSSSRSATSTAAPDSRQHRPSTSPVTPRKTTPAAAAPATLLPRAQAAPAAPTAAFATRPAAAAVTLPPRAATPAPTAGPPAPAAVPNAPPPAPPAPARHPAAAPPITTFPSRPSDPSPPLHPTGSTAGGKPLPLFWALEVDSLREGQYRPPPGLSPLDSEWWAPPPPEARYQRHVPSQAVVERALEGRIRSDGERLYNERMCGMGRSGSWGAGGCGPSQGDGEKGKENEEMEGKKGKGKEEERGDEWDDEEMGREEERKDKDKERSVSL